MKYALTLLALILPVAALAHPGAHPHPHGVEYGWIIAALVGFAGGAVAMAVVRGRRK